MDILHGGLNDLLLNILVELFVSWPIFHPLSSF